MKSKASLLLLVCFLTVGLVLAGCGRRKSDSQTVSQLPSSSDDASATSEDFASDTASAAAEPEVIPEPEPEMAPEPQPEPEPVTATVRATGYCNFEFDRSNLGPDEVARIDDLMARISPEQVEAISVDGHCDHVGTHPYNDGLGLKRARTVQGYLNRTYGIPVSTISCTSFGKRRPIDSNETEGGRARNRRTEIVVSYTKN